MLMGVLWKKNYPPVRGFYMSYCAHILASVSVFGRGGVSIKRLPTSYCLSRISPKAFIEISHANNVGT